ncbi:MAG: hypothetical protein KDM91_18530, partial [Verrucomicrobiae bacterium]|nr:hypothetical protein [Verrucomicrobiae bacterium]
MKAFLSFLRGNSWLQAVTLTAMLPGLVFLPSATRANPTGGVVTHGAVEFGDGLNGQLQLRQTTNKAII